VDVRPTMRKNAPGIRDRVVPMSSRSAARPSPVDGNWPPRLSLRRYGENATYVVPRWRGLPSLALHTRGAMSEKPSAVRGRQQRLSLNEAWALAVGESVPPTELAPPAPPHNRGRHNRGAHPLQLPLLLLLLPAVLPLRNYTFLPGADVFSTVRRRSLLTEATSPDSATGMVHWSPPARAKGTGLSPRDFPFTKIWAPIAAGLFLVFSTGFLPSNSTDHVEISQNRGPTIPPRIFGLGREADPAGPPWPVAGWRFWRVPCPCPRKWRHRHRFLLLAPSN
jgi:hypothetical protein